MGAAFKVAVEEVTLVESMEHLDAASEVIVEVRELNGEFSLHCCIYLLGLGPQQEFLHVACSVSRSLSADVLIPDRMADPYTMILVHAGGAVEGVSLDVEALDERNEYRVSQLSSRRVVRIQDKRGKD